MALTLSQLGQVSLTVDDVDVAERFYGETLGLRKFFRFGDLLFFDCSGVRLFIEKSNSKPFTPASSILYFRTPDIGMAFHQLKSRGVSFIDKPHMIAPMEDHDLWMAFFKDPSGNTMGVMQEAPKGYRPDEDQMQ